MQEVLDGGLGTCAGSAADDLPQVSVIPETLYAPSPRFQTLQTSLGQPVRLPAKPRVSQMIFWSQLDLMVHETDGSGAADCATDWNLKNFG